MIHRSFLALALSTTIQSGPARPVFDVGSARNSLLEAKSLCERDASELWGVSLCGPLMIVDQNTRRVVANVADPKGALQRDGDIFVGTLPSTVGIANTAVRWDGMDWTMVRWPLPDDRVRRETLLIHEAWHRIQPQLGLSTSERVQQQLATLEGRLSMRLELRALQRAVTLDDQSARQALADALVFRSWRYARFPEARANEAALEANEGLAEYTGWKISQAILDRERLASHLGEGERANSLARNFAYYTGPAYGALLDRFGRDWRVKARADVALPLEHISNVSSQAFEQAARHYRYAQLRSEEQRSEGERRRTEAHYRAFLIDGPTLTIPMLGANIVFDPNTVRPLSEGNVYPTLKAIGSWGSLDATDGVLISSDWSALTVTARRLDIEAGTITAAGWRMELRPGWSVQGPQGRRRLVQSDQRGASATPK